MVADLSIELFQDALVDAREDVSRNQRFRLKFVKARRELQFVLHGAAQLVQVLVILAGTPFMDDAVTVRLVGLGNETLQAFQDGGVHRLRKRGQQNVRCKVAQRLVLFLDVASVLPRELPEGFDAAKLADVLQDAVRLFIETRGKDGDDDILRGTFAQTGENRHNVDVELEGRLIVPPDPAQLLNTLFAVEELCIELDRLPHCGRRCDIQLIHLHRDKICAEWFAVIFNVLKPVIFVTGVCNRAIDKIVAVQVIVKQQLLDGKIVCASQLDNLDAFQIQLVNVLLKLPILVLPEDDPASIELRQGGCKTLRQIKLYALVRHGVYLPYLIFASTSANSS